MPFFTVDMKFGMPTEFVRPTNPSEDLLFLAMEELVDKYNGAAIHADYGTREMTVFIEIFALTHLGAKYRARRIFQHTIKSTLPNFYFKPTSRPNARLFVPTS